MEKLQLKKFVRSSIVVAKKRRENIRGGAVGQIPGQEALAEVRRLVAQC